MLTRFELLWIVAGLLPLAGCQSQTLPSAVPALPLAGQTVELLVPADLALQEVWEPLLQEWHSATGGEAQWTAYNPADPPWNQEADLANTPGGGRLILFPLARLSDVYEAGWLSPFPAAVIDTKDIFPGLKESVLSRQKALVAAPVSAPVLLCYYRKDLLEAAGRKPPKTWEEYQQLVDDLPQWATGLSACEPCGSEFRASLFLARSAAFCRHPQNYSVWFDIQTGDPQFDSPGFARALELTRQAWSKMPADIWRMQPAECRQAILTGKAALGLTWEPSTSYPRLVSQEDRSKGDPTEPLSIGVTSLPGAASVYDRGAKRWETLRDEPVNQPGFTGFTGLAIGVQAGQGQAAAWNLLPLLVEQKELSFLDQPHSLCRESEVMAPLAEDKTISVETASLIVDATAETLRRRNVVTDLAVPQAEDIQRIIATELESARDDSESTGDILRSIQERVAAAIQNRKEAVRDSYRRSLGLPAVK